MYVYLILRICYFVYTGHVITMKILYFLSLFLWTITLISKIAGQFQSRGKMSINNDRSLLLLRHS